MLSIEIPSEALPRRRKLFAKLAIVEGRGRRGWGSFGPTRPITSTSPGGHWQFSLSGRSTDVFLSLCVCFKPPDTMLSRRALLGSRVVAASAAASVPTRSSAIAATRAIHSLRATSISALSSARVGSQVSRHLLTSRVSPITATSRWAQGFASSAVQEQEPETVAEDEADLSPSSSDIPSGPLPFAALKGRISHNTLKALTFRPFQFERMSEVQERVLGLMPELVGGRLRGELAQLDAAARTAAKGSGEGDDPEVTAETQLEGHRPDLLVKAKTGTGKTVAFLVPALQSRLAQLEREGWKSRKNPGERATPDEAGLTRRDVAKNWAGTLVISPTRELATQIANEAIKIGSWHKLLEVRLLVGGESRMGQVKDFKRGRLDTIVATPGRLRDLVEDEGTGVAAALAHCETLVLDEADTLLEMGFQADLEAILRHLPPKESRQTFLFSATVSPQIRKIARESLKPDHLVIDCVPADESNVHAHIPQHGTVLSSASEQLPHVLRLLAHDQLTHPDRSKAIVFLPTTKLTQLYATMLRELRHTLPAGRDIEIIEMHSKKDQRARSRGADKFRNSRARASILVTSDVSARGVDYPGVTRVIQLGVPSTPDQYIHRVGRTGRGGKQGGRGDLILLPWEAPYLRHLREVPLKSTPVDALAEEVAELAREHDEDPKAFRQRRAVATAAGDAGKGRDARRQAFAPSSPYLPSLAKLDASVEALLPNLDQEAINEVFTSMLGYYAGHADELNADKMEIVAKLKTWAVEAGGLEEAPYVSASFLQKLGISSRRSSPRSGGGSGGRSSFGVRSGGGDRGGGGGGGGGGFERRFGGGNDRFRAKDRFDGGGGGGDRFRSRDSREGGFGGGSGGFSRDRGAGGFDRREGGRSGGFSRDRPSRPSFSRRD